MKNILPIICLLFLVIPPAFGQNSEKKRYKATQISVAPVIDGLIDEQLWNEGEWTNDFTQFEPYNGKQPSQHTEFKILFDANNLFIAIKSYDTSPDSIIRRMTRRDHEDGDIVAIIFDSFHDQRTGFSFGVSAGGVKIDQMMTNDGQNEDQTWDPNWWVATSINHEGWFAEMKIPFSQLRFKGNSGEVWGLEVARTIYRKQETCIWQHIPRDAPGFIHLFGELSGIEQVKPRKIFDVTPYGVAQTEFYPPEEGNPFMTGRRSKLNAGLDTKIGVTNNLTMDLTLNPDFGQVEADPSEVNLTAYETYFKEKRPFFIEGKNIISFGLGMGDGEYGNDNLFYSRRIGRKPQGNAYPYYGSTDQSEGYSQIPDRTSIIGAAKLTGKTQDGLSVGLMDAVTSAEVAEIDTGGHKSEQIVEPLTNYLAARLQKDYKEGNTIIGGMFTSVNRKMEDIPLYGTENDALINNLPSAAYSGGIDFTQYFIKKTYMLGAHVAGSYIEGTEEAMVQAQRSSVRYFQRPGNSITLDSSRTSLSGSGGRMQFMKTGNGHLNYGGAFLWKTPGLELNDIGYMRETDEMLQLLWAQYRLWEPKSFYREVNINISQYAGWDFSGMHLFDGFDVNSFVTFRNYWSAGLGSGLQYNIISNSMLRGGPYMKMPGSIHSRLKIETDSRKKLGFELVMNHSVTFEGSGQFLSMSPEINYKPFNTLSLSLDPLYLISYDELQYADQKVYGDQDRYIYGSIDQKVIRLSFRVNYNITPDLTIQYWGQPFIAAGKYYEYKYITDPMASEYQGRFAPYSPDQMNLVNDEYYSVDENIDGNEDYSFEKPDFNYREFLSNFVIRWEYNPGSTVYFVWSQTRSDSTGSGTMDYTNDVGELFSVRPHNVFLLKFSYRFGLR